MLIISKFKLCRLDRVKSTVLPNILYDFYEFPIRKSWHKFIDSYPYDKELLSIGCVLFNTKFKPAFSKQLNSIIQDITLLAGRYIGNSISSLTTLIRLSYTN